jgi:hypothetical protein
MVYAVVNVRILNTLSNGTKFIAIGVSFILSKILEGGGELNARQRTKKNKK